MVVIKQRSLILVQRTNSWNLTKYQDLVPLLTQLYQPQHNRIFPFLLYIVLVTSDIAPLILPVVQGFLVVRSTSFENPISTNHRVTGYTKQLQLQLHTQQHSHHLARTILNMDPIGSDTTTLSSNTDVTSLSSSLTDVPTMKFIHGLQEIINDYDVFFIDMWGVLHDGKQPYEHVLHTIQQMKRSDDDENPNRNNKVLILLSNSSKRHDHSIQNLQQLGFCTDDFHTVITSGEVTYQMLQSISNDDNGTSMTSTNPLLLKRWETLRSILSNSQEIPAKTKKVFILGSGDDDIAYCTSCGWTPVADINDAHLILARGPFTVPTVPIDVDGTNRNNYNVIDRRSDGEDMYQQTIQNVLQIAADKLIPMIISNPDKVRPDADRSPMPGQIGDLYESIIKQRQQLESSSNNSNPSNDHIDPASLIKRIGKPFPDVYDMAINSLSDRVIDKSRMCMIGDALETDVTGGTMFGISTIWVLSNGVHSIDIQNNLSNSGCSDDDILKSANVVLNTFNNNNVGTYAQGKTLAPTFVIPYFQW